jgi:two-component system, NarL family, invasion response regulator UvrY
VRCPGDNPRKRLAQLRSYACVIAEPPTALLVDDHDLFRGGLRDVLEDSGVRIVGEAGDGERAVELVRELRPDVVVMDLNMPGMGGVEATRRILADAPEQRVLVLTITVDQHLIDDALAAGAAGYLLKDAPVDDIAAAVKATSPT